MAEDHEVNFKQIGIGLSIAVILMFAWTTWFEASPGIITKPEVAYDFIIVGAGTAGCVLASRLSENPDFEILLIEAGGEETWLSSIPLAAPLLQKSNHDWQFKTEPQDDILFAFHRHESLWPRGKLLGGSGQINYNVHSFGSPQEYDRWETEFGAEGWGFEDMEKYENKMQCIRNRPNRLKPVKNNDMECKRHLTDECDSPTEQKSVEEMETRRKLKDSIQCYEPNLRTTLSDSELSHAFIEAGRELGLPVGNLNRDIDYGFMAAESTVYQGKRWGALSGYLRPVLGKRKNLHVLPNTHVTKVLWDGTRATGVEYIKGGNITSRGTIFARGEVVLSSGTINTPTILIHSGIGPNDVLEKFKIPHVSTLEGVGQNLQDHLSIPIYFTLDKPVSLNLSKLRSLGTLWDYFINGKGDLGRSAIEGVATVPIARDSPEVAFILFNMGAVDKEMYSSVANIKQELFNAMFPAMKNESSEGFILLASCLHPRSRGTINIHNTDPRSPPRIQPNYLKHPSDMACMRDAFKFGYRLSETTAFQSIGARPSPSTPPNCEHLKGNLSNSFTFLQNKDYLSCIIKTFGITNYHPIGTARMGKDSDSKAVVDHKLRVFGVPDLRIVDASVMPTHVSLAPNSVVILIAEKASDMIKNAWKDVKMLKNRIPCTFEECPILHGSSPGSINKGNNLYTAPLEIYLIFILIFVFNRYSHVIF